MNTWSFLVVAPVLAIALMASQTGQLAAQPPESIDRASAAETIVRWAVLEKAPQDFGPTERARILARRALDHGPSRVAVTGIDRVDLVNPLASCEPTTSYCEGAGQWAFQLDRLELTPNGASFTIAQVIWNQEGRVSEVIKYSGVLPRRASGGWSLPVDVVERFLLFGG